MGEVPGRSPSGVRLAGDEYQHLVTWNEVLLALRPGSDVTRITVEAREAGNVDDIVVERGSGPTVYTQVKHAVDAATPVGTTWLTATPGGARSLLRRFRDSWSTLSAGADNLEMQLVTDREVDPSDGLMRLLDRRTELLVPAIASAVGGDVAKTRAVWASHLGIDENALLEMLTHLRFRTGRPYNAELERADSLMWGHGLRTGRVAVDSAIAFVREWVQERWRTFSVDDLRRRVDERIGLGGDPSALLVVEAIDDDLHPEDATERLRWVELYEGDDPNRRRTTAGSPGLGGHHRTRSRGRGRTPPGGPAPTGLGARSSPPLRLVCCRGRAPTRAWLRRGGTSPRIRLEQRERHGVAPPARGGRRGRGSWGSPGHRNRGGRRSDVGRSSLPRRGDRAARRTHRVSETRRRSRTGGGP